MDLDAFEKRFNRFAPVMEKLAAAWPEVEEMLGIFKKMKEHEAARESERQAYQQSEPEMGQIADGAGNPVETSGAEVTGATADQNSGTTEPAAAPDGSAPSTENPAPPQS